MATYCFHRLIMGNVEIGNFYCLIGDNSILFLQKCLLNSSPHFIRLLSELLKDRDSTVPKRGSVFIGLMTPDDAIWSRYQRAVLMR